MKVLLCFAFLFLMGFQELSHTYSPLEPGNRWIYKMQDGSFEDYISEKKFIHNKIEYFQSIRKYSDGAADISYFRIDKSGAIYYLDPKSFRESIEIPAKAKLFFKWTSSDNIWTYEIVELDATLKTPRQNFKNCLVIKAEQIAKHKNENKSEVYFNYYSKGIGFVGSKVNGNLMAYLDKWSFKHSDL